MPTDLARLASARLPDSDAALMSVAQEGVRLADMLPGQKAAVATWLRNEAGKLYWRAQGDLSHDPERAERALGMRNQMIAKAVEIEEGLAR
ncbi:hypothetical protein I5G62_gp73 [Mycobacterium phage CRB2]|uniref:Uncharacterized protein n=1 Tax=Mycobacterium phage CRB2 TaxID=2483623 RepID=A0A455M3U1_9CAUD|nr:hypothetical protein I5G62_gp73 [Mycobacterium phage CRB2]AYP70059.1 hypothetical protein CRB2_73 [Mycobacterium phage CRB2]